MKKRHYFFKLKLFCCVWVLGMAGIHAVASSQPVSVRFTNVSLHDVIWELEKQTSFSFIYNTAETKAVKIKELNADQTEALEVLNRACSGSGLTFEVQDDVVIIKPVPVAPVVPPAAQQIRITGKVIDDATGEAIPFVSVLVKETTTVTITLEDGTFAVNVPGAESVLRFSFVGYEPLELKVDPSKVMDVRMRSTETGLQAAVVTGIYTRSRESFTGSAATFGQKELISMGTSNVLQSLKTLDPSFAIRENVQFGSDPNRLPDIEVRGKSSMLGLRDELDTDPNQPLFILDGFESSLAVINDLDINRIESITILKDAASTAIYGSKAANGVVVVETVKPTAGRLRVSYNGSANISIPDLTSYNLMNAKEKVEFEYLAGVYNQGLIVGGSRIEYELWYQERLRALAEGIDTYWLAEPLRVGINQRHSLHAVGGEKSFMFGIGANYNGITGVMKDSKRDVIGANIDVTYRVSKFQFSNKSSVNIAGFTNPIVPFVEFAHTNPYYKKTNDEGVIEQWLEYKRFTSPNIPYNHIVPNPLWNARLNSRNQGSNVGFSNFFIAEWFPSVEWKIRGRFGITADFNETEIFTSPEDSRQIMNKEAIRRGEFRATNQRGNRYEGEFTAAYAKLLGKNRIHLVGGGNIYSNSSLSQGYGVEGFPLGGFSHPPFAGGYIQNGNATYSESISRSVNAYFNAGYAFDDRYLMDFSLRTSGSSVFGTTQKFNTTWSVGLGWNLHREDFIKNSAKWINHLKLRASIGNPGNQNFNSASTLLTYSFQYGIVNYFGIGALPDQIGNPDLQWQVTVDKNAGFDLTALDRRLSVNFDYYHKVTDPLLVRVETPLSSGTSVYFTNAGKQTSEGLTFTATYHILRDLNRRILWNVRVNGRAQKNIIDNIGDQLSLFNSSGRGVSTTRYFDGADPDDLWGVRSAGIDPSTGRELFVKKEGGYTYDFSYDDEVVIGNTRPKLEGIIGTSFTWKMLTVNLNFRYRYGADLFNSVVRDKVEGVDPAMNQDRRALYERWTNPGDFSRFKDIRDINGSPMTSRFVQRENVFTLESLHIEYQFTDGWIKKLNLSNLKAFFSMRDVFRASTVRVERGIQYPFARTMDVGLSFNF